MLVVLLAVAAVASATPTIPRAAQAMYNPKLFQGDIMGIAGQEPGVSVRACCSICLVQTFHHSKIATQRC